MQRKFSYRDVWHPSKERVWTQYLLVMMRHQWVHDDAGLRIAGDAMNGGAGWNHQVRLCRPFPFRFGLRAGTERHDVLSPLSHRGLLSRAICRKPVVARLVPRARTATQGSVFKADTIVAGLLRHLRSRRLLASSVGSGWSSREPASQLFLDSF
jgi:hypothetical protein